MRSSPSRLLFRLSRILLALSVVGLLPLTEPAAAAPKRVRVFDAGEVERLDFAPAPAARRGARQARRAARLSFDAQGRRFALDLRENLELLSALPAATRERIRARHEIYRGELAGRPGSWVRLTRSGKQWTGLLYDGSELLAMEPAADLAAAGRRPRASGLAFYRLRDVEMDGTCALEAGAATPTMQGMVDELGALAPSLATAASQLNVAVVGDPAFVQGQGDPEGAAIAVLNAVDGLYAQQVGVSIRVAELMLLPTPQGLTSNDAATLLGQLSNLTTSGAVSNPGLVHLLTGRNLDGSTIGIAYLSVLCNTRFGIGLSEIQGGSLAANTVLVAHEMGHNFGAPHDNQSGSVCASTPNGYVMNPFLNPSATQFSACSLSQMASQIARASCLVDLPDPPPDPTPTPDPSCLFSTSFTTDTAGFEFVPDAENPGLTSGSSGAGALESSVGGVDNVTALGLSGAWARSCTMDTYGLVNVTLQARLTQASGYEADEVSEVALVVNGERRMLASFAGDGNGGVDQDTGLRTFVIETALPAGTSTLQLECSNSKKTTADEVTRCQFAALEIAPYRPGCSNGADDDGDGRIDYPDDPECVTAAQWSESDPACGLGFEAAPFLVALMRLRRRRARTRPARGARACSRTARCAGGQRPTLACGSLRASLA